MDKAALARVLELHQRAYGALLWIGRQIQRQSQLASHEVVAELRDPAECAAWVRRHCREFPSDAQPAEADVTTFALLLSSFFKTSFHVDQVECGGHASARLTRGAQRGAHGRKARRRDHQTIRDLELIALKALAEEAGIVLAHEQAQDIVGDSQLAADLGLWSYACELCRRAEYASQGPAVHRLWLDLPEAQRRKLSADMIWDARTRLLAALNGRACVERTPQEG